MKCKSEVFLSFKTFKAFFEKDGKFTILNLCSNNGGEYISNEFSAFLSSAGICHSPQLNFVAKRANRTIANHIRCSLLSSPLPKSFWADALRHFTFSFNSIPCNTPSGFLSPVSLLNISPVKLSSLHPFGCLVWYKVPNASCKKLNPKARSSVLLSYLPDGNGYRVLNLQTKSIIKTPLARRKTTLEEKQRHGGARVWVGLYGGRGGSGCGNGTLVNGRGDLICLWPRRDGTMGCQRCRGYFCGCGVMMEEHRSV